MWIQPPPVKSTLTVSQRICRSPHIPQIFIGTDMQVADHFQIIIQHLIEIPALRTGLCQNHRQMKAYRTHIKTSHKYGLVILVCRIHAASLIPGAQKRAASHRADYFPVTLIHTGNISLPGHRQPVRIHCFCRTADSCLEPVLTLFSRAMNVFVIQKDNFRKQHRLTVSRLPLPLLVNVKQGYACHFLKTLCAKPQGNRYKRIIPPGRTDGIQLVLNPLPALFKVAPHLIHGIRFSLLGITFPGGIPVFEEFFFIFPVTLFRIGRQHLIYLRHRKAAVLLRRRTQNDISHYIKRRIQRLWLIVPHVPHLKAVFQDCRHIKQTAIHRIQPCRLVMDINITVFARLAFIPCHKKFPVQLFIQLIENQAPLRSH